MLPEILIFISAYLPTTAFKTVKSTLISVNHES